MYERKSVRNYQDKPVPDDVINELLKAAIQAPSGMNEQPWGFVIVKDRGLLKEMSDFCKKKLRILLFLAGLVKKFKPDVQKRLVDKIKSKGLNLFYNSPCLILVCARKKAMSKILDASAAAQNMLLAAHSLGLGGCWIGLAMPLDNNEKWRERLGISRDYMIVAPIIIGYPDDASVKRERQEPLILKKIG
ncbi:MAG: nitroreductase [Candidatus Omnitrophica bacterium]|nr:nitroreductase [Candidatus Omnitrophota bacterium]